MAVKAYVIHKEIDARKLPHYLLASTGPFLFRSEADKFAHFVTAATGSRCQLSTIQTERLLNEAVRLGDRLLTTNVWNIRATEDGFMGEVVIQGRLGAVHRSSYDEPWHAIGKELQEVTDRNNKQDFEANSP